MAVIVKDQAAGLARMGLLLMTIFWMVLTGTAVVAAPYAAMVMDARSGKVLHSRNADTRLHPASLTKMMTLYIVFEALRRGEITLETKVRVSKNAAAEPPSKLGLKAGQKIALKYLVRASAVKSANDAATAMGEAISGSEAAFARRMNRTAKALGMTRTTFKNAHGLTEAGHMSTARDMSILGRRLLFDYPQFYNLFSRRTTHAGVKTVNNTNTRLLNAYEGADGIKTGYTRAAGFNLVASAVRGNERVIATVFGGRSTASRNAKVAELLDLGFSRSPTRVAVRKPVLPTYEDGRRGGKTIRVVSAVKKSLRPRARPVQTVALVEKNPELTAVNSDALEDSVETALSEAVQNTPPPEAKPTPPPKPVVLASANKQPPIDEALPKRPSQPQVVTRLSTAGDHHWGINVGRYGSRYEAERVLLKIALAEMSTLETGLRKVKQGSRGFDANFIGLTRETADLACRRLQARKVLCFMIGPS